MSLESSIARRYLFGKDRPFMAGVLSAVAIGAVAVSVFALIVVQAVMAGFSQDLREKILRFSPPILLKPVSKDYLSGKKVPPLPIDTRITQVSPSLETEVIVHTADEMTQGAKLKGVSLENPDFLNRLKPDFVEGLTVRDLSTQEETLPGILLGTELAKRLNILPFLTEEIELIYPFGEVDPTGEMRPKTRRFRVIGTFKTGYYDYDNKFMVTDLAEARRLVPIQEIPTEWGIWVKDFFEADSVASRLSESLKGSFRVEGWGERNRKLFSALKLERVAMFVILGVMIAIGSFNIFSLTMMMVVSKAKEIATFRALGLSQQKVGKIFVRMGLVLGIVGTAIGVLFASVSLVYLHWKPLRVPSSYYLEALPVKIEPLSILLVVLVAPFLAFIASWYPARRGGRFDISESLRYQ